MPAPAVRVRDLVVRYGPRSAVAGLTFEAQAGEVTALVGPNGAGKTSTVETCVGLRSAASGSVEILGVRQPAEGSLAGALRSDVGVMLQDGGLYPTARPLELARHIASLYADPDDPERLLAALGVDPGTRTTIRRLSGGEQQRVKCALALVGRPRLVFLDEPTAGLDTSGRRAVHDLIAGLRAGGTSVVLTTHLMDDVERLADHVVVISRGRDVSRGSVADLVGDDDTIAFSGPVNADLRDLVAVLPDGCRIEEDRPGRYRVSAAADPMILSAIAAWCAQHGVRTSGLTVGRRSRADVVLELTEGQE